jgi:succinoglycan biosynthesis protein ExoO
LSIDATRPLVSVIMANYNGADHVAGAVRSVLNQSLASLELILSDDGSTDGGLERARAAAGPDERLRILEGGPRSGPGAARNRAIRAARGEWIAVVDSDDFIHRERLERLLAAAERDGADIVADDLLVFYEDQSRRPHPFLRGRRAKAASWVSASDYVDANIAWAGGATLGYLKPIVRRAVAGDALLYDETVRIAEDFDLIARLLASGARMRIYPELLYFYRKHAGSISHRLSAHDLETILAAHDRLAALAPAGDPMQGALRRRRASLEGMRAFTALVEALKARDWLRAARVAAARPAAVWGLRIPLIDRLRGRRRPRPRPVETQKPVTVISRQRVVSATNGSSCYLLALARSLRDAGHAVDFICASPKAFGRWPVLRLQPEIDVFSRYSVCGGLRTGRLVWAADPRVALRGALAASAWALARLTRSRVKQPRPADYAVAARAERRDMLHVARNARPSSLAVLCDYAFLAPLAPFALAPQAPTITIMHDLLSSRVSDDGIERIPTEITTLSAEDEYRLLAMADVVVAIQPEEGAQVRARLPAVEVLVAPHAARCAREPQPGEDDALLFVGSNTASNLAGLEWFLDQCWPKVLEARPRAELVVAGSVNRAFLRGARGVRLVGVVSKLDRLYRSAGVVVAPLRTGSGLKIKLVEALGAGKAVVGTSISAQGVRETVDCAMVVRDEPAAFAAAVIELLGDRRRRTALGQAALTCAATHFEPACHAPLVARIGRGLPRPPSPQPEPAAGAERDPPVFPGAAPGYAAAGGAST